VDAVVTDKKGHYVTDLTQGDFKVFEDNKEQAITSFSSEANAALQAAGQRHYMILFFDNSSMEMGDQIQARDAAQKFVSSNAGPDHLMAIVNFGGSLVIRQNFTADAKLLQAAVTGINAPHVSSNPEIASAQGSQPVVVATTGLPSLNSVETDFGARSMLLSIRSLAKNQRAVHGRKMLILFTAGFPLNTENMSELTATIDACNKANVAIYALDVRGLVAPTASLRPPAGNRSGAFRGDRAPRLVLASFAPQHTGGGGGGTGGGAGRGARVRRGAGGAVPPGLRPPDGRDAAAHVRHLQRGPAAVARGRRHAGAAGLRARRAVRRRGRGSAAG